MKHKIWFDAQYKIVREEIIGSFAAEDVGEYLAVTRQVLNGIKHRKILVDYSHASRRLYDSKQVRKMLIDGTVDLGYIDETVAILAADPVVALQATAMAFGAKAKGKRVKVQWFEDEAEAIAWLKQEETVSEASGMV